MIPCESASKAEGSAATLELHTHSSIRDVGEAEWDALLQPDDPPFLSFAWLDALEQTGCVRPDRGWAPLLLTLREDDELVAAAPAYVKGNSEGEFVFDHGWARFAEGRLGVEYYPKLIIAVPFTPATGKRLLIKQGADQREVTAAFAQALRQLVDHFGLSSAHVLFPAEEQAELLSEHGLTLRLGVQFHWRNEGYGTFDDFLGRFNSKRRNAIRRERRELERQGTRLESLSGRELTPDLVDHVFEFYRATVERFYWGRQYLNRDFFHEVVARMPDAIHVVLARDASSKKPIGGAFNLVSPRALFGRYWGAREERPFLHFNVCYYRGIEDAIARGLQLFEPGAGGEHKLSRGFDPSATYSVHHLADPRLAAAIADFTRREAEDIRHFLHQEAKVSRRLG
jgi:hypothetical protein